MIADCSMSLFELFSAEYFGQIHDKGHESFANAISFYDAGWHDKVLCRLVEKKRSLQLLLMHQITLYGYW